jgi:hypothetical protein
MNKSLSILNGKFFRVGLAAGLAQQIAGLRDLLSSGGVRETADAAPVARTGSAKIEPWRDLTEPEFPPN